MRTRSFTVALILFDEVELLDVAGVVQALSLCGRQWNWRPFKIVPVAAKIGPIATRNQLSLAASHDLSSCPAPELILVPGGYGARVASDDGPIVEFVRQHAPAAQIAAAIGQGALVLARAGLLQGAEVAASNDVGALLSAIAPDVRCDPLRPVCESGRVLTARSGAASIDLGLAIIARLLGKKPALAVANELGHTAWQSERLEIEILPAGG